MKRYFVQMNFLVFTEKQKENFIKFLKSAPSINIENVIYGIVEDNFK